MGSGSLIFLLFGSLVRNAGLWEPALWERARPAKGRQSRPAGSQRPCYCAASRRLWYPAGWLKPPFRGRGPLAQVATPPEVERQIKSPGSFEPGLFIWRPLGESNPCYRRERAVSWATRRRGRIWWSQAGSNRRPLQCHCSALPAELWPQKLSHRAAPCVEPRILRSGLTLSSIHPGFLTVGSPFVQALFNSPEQWPPTPSPASWFASWKRRRARQWHDADGRG